MANEFLISASIGYDDSEGSEFTVAVADIIRSITDKAYIRHKQLVGTSEEALNIGDLETLGWSIFVNRDEVNYCEIRSASGDSNDVILIPPLCPALYHFGSDVTDPYAIANAAPVQLEYTIWAR